MGLGMLLFGLQNVKIVDSVKNVKGSIFKKAVNAYTDIFDSNLSPSYSVSLFRIYCSFSGRPTTLFIVRWVNTSNVIEYLNARNPLKPDSAYIFDVVVESGQSINLQCESDTEINYLIVIETPIMV